MTIAEQHAGLYVVVEASADPALSARLDTALDGTACASLLIVPPPGLPLETRGVMPLIQCAQRHGIATLLADDAPLAKAAGADGVHLSWRHDPISRYDEARAILGQRCIAGADAGSSRDDAMRLGEAGADYVSFGIGPDEMDRESAAALRLDLVAWWAELFEVPCVAFDAETREEAAALSQAGADFVAVRLPSAPSAETVSKWLRDMTGALRAPASID